MASSPRPPRTVVRRCALALVVLGLASGCGGSNPPGVAVTNAQTDVVFGTTATPPPAAPAAPGGDVALPAQPAGFLPAGPGVLSAPAPAALPPLVFGAKPAPFVFPDSGDGGSAAPKPAFCPGPPIGSTAPAAATTSVKGQPKPGFYLWQLIRSEQISASVASRTTKYANDEVRNVSAVTRTPNPQGAPTETFTYDLVSPMAKGHTITFTYQVKQGAPGANVGTGNVGKPTRVSAPDAGVAILKEVERDADGKTVGSFTPSTAVLVLPLPVVGGATFTGSGTDPTTGGQLTVRGTVKGPDRVTGCSEYVQGQRVDATVTSSATQGQAAATVEEVFTVETQTGALVVGTAQTPSNSKITTLSVVGENTPSATRRDIPKDLQP